MSERNRDLDILVEWFSKRGIDAVLLDLDDTLLDTNRLFGNGMRRFISSVVDKNPQLNWVEVYEKFEELNDRASESLAVRKSKFEVVAKELDDYFHTQTLFSKHSDVVLRIYNTYPHLLSGALDTLNIFEEVGLTMGLVTHANYDWTNLKLDNLGLRKYFSHIEIVDENRHKGPQDWLNAINSLGIAPKKALAIGDNLSGDIVSSYRVGVKHGVWIKPKWNIYAKGDVPDGVIKVDNIGEVIGALINS